MKKYLPLILAAAMLFSSLVSCRMPERHDYFGEAMQENPEIELPKSEIMEVDPDTIPKYEIEDKISDYDGEERLQTDDGELIVKYKICDYKDQNVAIVSVENHAEQALTIRIKGICEDTLMEKTKSMSRTFYGFAAGWQNYFVFPPQMEFDEFSYEIQTEPYDGETYGQYVTNLEWQDIALSRYGEKQEGVGRNDVLMTMVWMYDWGSNEQASYAAHYVLLDKEGAILALDMDEVIHLAQKDLDHLKPIPSGWNRSPLYYMLEVDPSVQYNELNAKFNNSLGSNCALYPASDAFENTGYELPEKYRDVYGIVCFTGIWGEESPAEEIPPDRSLYLSY